VVGRSSSARPVPAIGLAVGVFLTMIVAAAWVLPAANRQFHVTVYALASQSDIASAAGRLPETPADLSPPALVASAMRRPAGPGMGVLLFRTGLASLAAAFVVLGSAVSRLPAGRRRKWTAMLTTAYALGVGLMPSQWELGGHAPAVVGLIPWITAGWACVGAATLAAQPLPKET
jgi:hypothetical protein